MRASVVVVVLLIMALAMVADSMMCPRCFCTCPIGRRKRAIAPPGCPPCKCPTCGPPIVIEPPPTTPPPCKG
uniref:Secreted peptide n=1 Tax=Steinernema glaseri TaxID=37863 RepID=A0A1I8A560_9BILA